MDAVSALNSFLPDEFHIKKSDLPLTKAKLNKLLTEYAKKYPDHYAKNIHKIGDLGEELAYLHGHHVGINDLLHPNRKKIESFLEKENKKLSLMSTEKKKEHLIKLFDKVQELTMEPDGNHLVDQGKSRSRGNPATITRTIGASVYTVDMNSEPFPFLIKNSLSSGYRSHEMFAAGSQARYAAVQSATSTSEPGAMSKVLVANTEHLKICCKDCGTKNGIEYKIDDSQIIGRYEAGTNRLITKDYVNQLKKQRKKTIVVRDPITCQAKDGICAMCYGHNAMGKLYEPGHNIGIQASQTVGEKATQLVLSAKHNIKGKLTSNIPTGFEAQKILLNTPKSFRGKATISTTDGKVEKIERLNTGGYNVVIAGKTHYISPEVKPKVKVGDEVFKGQTLSTGLASPREIMEHSGVYQARKYTVDKLYEANGGDIDKRVFGVLARGYLELAKHKKDEMHELHNYDALLHTIEEPNTHIVKVSDRQITNKYLAQPFLHYSPGTKITPGIVKKMKQHGLKEVKVSHNPFPIVPVYKTYEQKPLANTTIWQKMNYRGIKKGLTGELLYNKETDINRLQSDRAKYTLGRL